MLTPDEVQVLTEFANRCRGWATANRKSVSPPPMPIDDLLLKRADDLDANAAIIESLLDRAKKATVIEGEVYLDWAHIEVGRNNLDKTFGPLSGKHVQVVIIEQPAKEVDSNDAQA